jgi:hypothetical protein
MEPQALAARNFSFARRSSPFSRSSSTSRCRSAVLNTSPPASARRTRKRALAALGVVKAFTAKGPGGVELQLKVEATAGTAGTGDPEEDLADLLATIGERAAKPYAPRLFTYHEIGRRSDAEAHRALVGPAGRQDVKYVEAAAKLVIDATLG